MSTNIALQFVQTHAARRLIGVVAGAAVISSLRVGCGIGLGYVESAHAKSGTGIEIEIRNHRFPAQVVKRPIFQKTS